MIPARVAPFRLAVDPAEIAGLRARLAATRWPDPAPGPPWEAGSDLAAVRELCRVWSEDFDWNAREEALNALPQVRVEVEGASVHAVHVRRGGPPLVLTHGWPSAFTEYLGLVDRLPEFDLVIPSLPGYGFSTRPARSTTRDVARRWVGVMEALGYRRFGAVGTDFGSAVASYLGLDHADRVAGVHLSNLDVDPALPRRGRAGLTRRERAYLRERDRWDAVERGYSAIQGTRPQSLAVGLGDSPAGLAAWILEKWRAWSDNDGDVFARIDREHLLELLTLYWVTGSIGTSLRDYRDNRLAGTGTFGAGERIPVPLGVANFHRSLASEGRVPRRWVQRLGDVIRFTDMPRGGHFAAVEEPALLADEIAAFFRDPLVAARF